MEESRGYHDEHELDWGTGLAGGLAVVVFVMYATSGHAREVLGPGSEGLVFLTPFVISALLRFHRRACEGASDSPLARCWKTASCCCRRVLSTRPGRAAGLP